jgi:prepilin-type N-terminal cleavage/methylation domain-containing protein
MRRVIGPLRFKALRRIVDAADVRSGIWTTCTRRLRRRGMTLPEMTIALALSSGVALSIGHVVHQMSRNVVNLEARAADGTETALAMVRLRTELRQATEILALEARRISFAHPDVNGDGEPDVLDYAWNGTAGTPLTRAINGAVPETILERCLGFTPTAIDATAGAEEVLAFHDAYTSGITATTRTLTLSNTQWAAQVFATARSGAASFRISRVRVYLEVGATSGSLIAALHSVSGGSPNSTLETVTRACAQIRQGPGWVDFYFGDNRSLSISNLYAITLRTTAGTSNVKARYDEISTGAPSSSPDYYQYTTNSGSTWQPTSSLTRRDLKYAVYGRYYDSGGNQLPVARNPVRQVRLTLTGGKESAPIQLQSAVQCVNVPEVVR